MAEGLINDCRRLLSRFESHQSVRFEVFSEVWREMNFSFIHCGRKDTNGRIQIVDYLYRIISSYLSPSCTFQYRVGALYALYAVFHTQLCKPKIKIRMTLPMWKDLTELHEQFQVDKHHDADYILRSLRNEKAFLFCATQAQLAYGSREAITSQEGEQTAAISLEANSTVNEAYGTVERLLRIHSKYQKLKTKVIEGSESTVNEKTIQMISDRLPTELGRDVEQFEEWKQNRCHQHVLQRPTSSILLMPDDNLRGISVASSFAIENPKETEEEARAALLHKLKQKSFRQVNKVSRSMRHLQPVASEEPKKRVRKKRRR